MFDKGQRVRIIESGPYQNVEVGDHGIVMEVFTSGEGSTAYGVSIERASVDHRYILMDDEVEAVPYVKVGDQVITIVRETSENRGKFHNKHGVVVAVDNLVIFPYAVAWVDNGVVHGDWFAGYELRTVDDAT